MSNWYQQLYTHLHMEQETCQMNSPSLSDSESGYWSALENWELLKHKLAEKPFENDAVAIFFFRHFKPRFIV